MYNTWSTKAQMKSQFPQGFWLFTIADNVTLCLLECMGAVYLFVKKYSSFEN
ncbi:hypothetical protein J2S16_003339 [Cytobacillus kochii]|nr:hypothetical protein [Cytobacillus kochii]